MIYLLLFLFFNPCCANAHELVHFQELIKQDESRIYELNGKEITIRGFLYRTDDSWILAAQPNLRSCCVGQGAAAKNQISVVGFTSDIDNRVSAVELKGTFKIDDRGRYLLENGSIVQDENHQYRNVLFLILGLGLLIATAYSCAAYK